MIPKVIENVWRSYQLKTNAATSGRQRRAVGAMFLSSLIAALAIPAFGLYWIHTHPRALNASFADAETVRVDYASPPPAPRFLDTLFDSLAHRRSSFSVRVDLSTYVNDDRDMDDLVDLVEYKELIGLTLLNGQIDTKHVDAILRNRRLQELHLIDVDVNDERAGRLLDHGSLMKLTAPTVIADGLESHTRSSSLTVLSCGPPENGKLDLAAFPRLTQLQLDVPDTFDAPLAITNAAFVRQITVNVLPEPSSGNQLGPTSPVRVTLRGLPLLNSIRCQGDRPVDVTTIATPKLSWLVDSNRTDSGFRHVVLKSCSKHLDFSSALNDLQSLKLPTNVSELSVQLHGISGSDVDSLNVLPDRLLTKISLDQSLIDTGVSQWLFTRSVATQLAVDRCKFKDGDLSLLGKGRWQHLELNLTNSHFRPSTLETFLAGEPNLFYLSLNTDAELDIRRMLGDRPVATHVSINGELKE